MKKTSFPLLLLIALTSFAQNVSLKWGPEFKKSGGLLTGFSSRMVYLGNTESNYTIFDKVGKKDMIITYDLDHKLIKQTEIDLSYNGQHLYADNVIRTKNKRYIGLNGFSRSDRKVTNYIWELNDNNAFVGTPKALASAEYFTRRVMFGLEAFFGPTFDTDLGGLTTSLDKTKILQISSASLLQTNEPESISLVLMDENLNILWKKNQTFSETDKKLRLTSASVLNDGRLLLLGKLNSSGSSDPDNEDFRYMGYVITETDMKSFEIKLPEGKSISGSIVFRLPDGTIKLAGLYTENNGRDQPNGLFFIALDCDKLTVSATTTPFNATVLDKVNAYRKKQSNKRDEVPNLKLSGGFRNEDGSFILSADQYFTEERTMYTNNVPKMITVFHYDDKFLFGLDNQGKALFQNAIDNHVVTQFSNGGMDGYSLPDNKVLLLYRKSEDTDSKHVSIIDTKGNVLTELDISYSNSEGNFMPDRFIRLNKTDFLISGINYTKYRFGTLKVE